MGPKKQGAAKKNPALTKVTIFISNAFATSNSQNHEHLLMLKKTLTLNSAFYKAYKMLDKRFFFNANILYYLVFESVL